MVGSKNEFKLNVSLLLLVLFEYWGGYKAN